MSNTIEDMNAQEPINAIEGTILIHIAFHYRRERIGYLKSLLSTFDAYKFSAIDIVIDTNNAGIRQLHPELFDLKKASITCKAHEHLAHPFLLTWQHREGMMKNLHKYDFFMYTEDDILIPWVAILKWYKDTRIIYSHGYVRTFLRVEKTPSGSLVSSDAEERIDNPVLKEIEGHSYILPIRPYCAFWIYTKEQMTDFTGLSSWQDVSVDFEVRERAAFGMIWEGALQHRALIPLVSNYMIDTDAIVYHLDSQYNSTERPHIKIPVDDLIISGKFRRFIHKMIRNCSKPFTSFFGISKKIARAFKLLFQ